MEHALRMLLDWGFREKDLATVIWLANVGNWASRRLAWKLGFTFEGTLRQWLPHRGELRDAWTGTLLADDPSPVRGRRAPTLLTPHDRRARVREVLARVRDGTTRPRPGGPDIMQTAARHKSGRIIPVELSMSVARGEDGPLVVAFVRDVSRRAAEEAERERARAERLRREGEAERARASAAAGRGPGGVVADGAPDQAT